MAAAFALVAAGSWFAAGSHPVRGERMEFGIPMKDETANLAISADGRKLVYGVPDESSGENILKIQSIGSNTAVTLA